jgi:hypothetical protein
MKLHVFGDSHSGSRGWSNINIDGLQIISHYIGPLTCSKFGFDKIKLLKDNGVEPGEIVCFVLGEIDCRMHIHKYKYKYKDIIDDIIEHYFIAIKMDADTIDNLIILVSSITPVPKDNTYITGDAWLPVGEDFERKIYVEYMNQKIKEKCEEYNYKFFDIYSQYCDAEGFLNSELSDGAIHIHNGKIMEEKLLKIINNN